MKIYLALLIFLFDVPSIENTLIKVVMKIDSNDLQDYAGAKAGKTLMCSFHMHAIEKSKSTLIIRKHYGREKLKGAPYDSQDQEEIYNFLLTNPQALPNQLLLRDAYLTPADTNWNSGGTSITFDAEELTENANEGYQERMVKDYNFV